MAKKMAKMKGVNTTTKSSKATPFFTRTGSALTPATGPKVSARRKRVK